MEEHNILRSLYEVLKVILCIYYPTKVRVLVTYWTIFMKHRVVNNHGISPIRIFFLKYVPLNIEKILNKFP